MASGWLGSWLVGGEPGIVDVARDHENYTHNSITAFGPRG